MMIMAKETTGEDFAEIFNDDVRDLATKLAEDFHNSFRHYCVENKQMDVWQAVETFYSLHSCEIGPRLLELAQVCSSRGCEDTVRGCLVSHERQCCATLTPHAPHSRWGHGPMIKLLRIILRTSERHQVTCGKTTGPVRMSLPYGASSTEELFSKLYRKAHLDTSAPQRVDEVQIALKGMGYMCKEFSSIATLEVTDQLAFDAIDALLMDVSLSDSKAQQQLVAHSHDGKAFLWLLQHSVDSGYRWKETMWSTSARPCVTSSLLWWDRQQGRGLRCCRLKEWTTATPIVSLPLVSMTAIEERDASFIPLCSGSSSAEMPMATAKSLPFCGWELLIGDEIELGVSDIEVDVVISVDALPTAINAGNAQDSTRCIAAVLLRGRLFDLTAAALYTSQYLTTHTGNEDARSEMAKHDAMNPSPNCNGLEENNLAAAQYSFETQHLIVLVDIASTGVIVRKVIPLLHVLEADQVPIHAKWLMSSQPFSDPSPLLLVGSHGLLTVFSVGVMVCDANVIESPSKWIGSETVSPQQHPGSSDTVCSSNTTADSPRAEVEMDTGCTAVEELHTVGHSESAAIIEVVCATRAQVVLSLDSHGTLCVWALPSVTMCMNGIASLKLLYSCSLMREVRPLSLQLSPNERQLLVGYSNRLLVMGLTFVEETVSITEWAQLDVVCGATARYKVHFENEDHMRIWRLSLPLLSHRVHSSRVQITTWSHGKIDPSAIERLVDSTMHGEYRCTAAFPFVACSLDSSLSEGVRVSNGKENLLLSSEVDQRSTTTGEFEHSADGAAHGNGIRIINDRLSGATVNSFAILDNEFVPVLGTMFEIDANNVNNDSSVLQPFLLTATQTTATDQTQQSTSRAMLCAASPLSTFSPRRSFAERLRQTTPSTAKACRIDVSWLRAIFGHDSSDKFHAIRQLLSTIHVCMSQPPFALICAALDLSDCQLLALLRSPEVSDLLTIEVSESFCPDAAERSRQWDQLLRTDPQALTFASSRDLLQSTVVIIRTETRALINWMCSRESHRIGRDFWIDSCEGHNRLCALFLNTCGNKSVAVDPCWQSYLQTYGPLHLRNASRSLSALTQSIRKIDETANLKSALPRQIGYVSGLQEIYARRVGLSGRIPDEIGRLLHLRVLSMGNNQLCGPLPLSLANLKNLQRIVLHQNNLSGAVPESLGELGCIVNVAGNPRLHYGSDVPTVERDALLSIFRSTKGETHWNARVHWGTDQPVCKWYKVGVLASHVHSLVMSTNGMDGHLPVEIGALSQLRMIELATMPGLTGCIPKDLCQLTTLRRLCICRCTLTGRIPDEIGQLIHLEELQLFGNHLSGIIPASIGQLVNLKLLSLGEYTGGNNFAYQPLPTFLAKLSKLEALFLANCNLKGAIPLWIGELTELRQLDLQRNQLMGPIPKSIGKLENLLYLNMKDNPTLGGRLPVLDMARLTKLNRLSLVHCNFTDCDIALDTLKVKLPKCKIWI